MKTYNLENNYDALTVLGTYRELASFIEKYYPFLAFSHVNSYKGVVGITSHLTFIAKVFEYEESVPPSLFTKEFSDYIENLCKHIIKNEEKYYIWTL